MQPTLFFKSIADDTRLKIVMLIQREQELCVCELMAALQDSQPKISRHLALLRENKLLVSRKQGQWVYYSINKNAAHWIKDVLTISTSHNNAFIEASIQRLQKMGDRPQRLESCCN